MTDYIEREAVRQELYDADAITFKGLRIINQFPAADVAPVVRGRWKKRRFGETAFGYECTICHTTWDEPTNFCPYCGARMDGETNEV